MRRFDQVGRRQRAVEHLDAPILARKRQVAFADALVKIRILALETIGLLFVGLVAAAGFAVMAQAVARLATRSRETATGTSTSNTTAGSRPPVAIAASARSESSATP